MACPAATAPPWGVMRAWALSRAFTTMRPDEALASGDRDVLVSIGVMPGATPEHVRSASRALDQLGLESGARKDAELLLAHLAGTVFDMAQLHGFVNEELFKASRLYAELCEVAYARAYAAGFAEGLAKVRAERNATRK